jgi:hypothetical protein
MRLADNHPTGLGAIIDRLAGLVHNRTRSHKDRTSWEHHDGTSLRRGFKAKAVCSLSHFAHQPNISLHADANLA